MKKINVRSPYYIEVAPKPVIIYYYSLQKCEDSSIGYVSEQTADEIALENDDRVQDASLNDYVVIGKVDITQGTYTSVGLITDTGETGCIIPPDPVYYALVKCTDPVTAGYRTGQETSEITLADDDQVVDSNNNIYRVSGETETGTNVGTVIATGETGCPAIIPPIAPQTIQVNCGGTHNVAADVGVVTYQINTPNTGTFRANITGSNVPQKFTLKWNGSEVTSDYIGSDFYDQDLLDEGIPIGEIATGTPSTKTNTFLEINKSASTPNLVELVVNAPLINDEYSVNFVCPEPAPVTIVETTQINIWFDASGSMNTTLTPLQQMAAGNLKDCLVQFYDNDPAKYDQYVRVRSFTNERTFERALQPPSISGATNCINIIFQDESAPPSTAAYCRQYPWSPAQATTSFFDYDIRNLRDALTNNSVGYITPIVFQVDEFYSGQQVYYFQEFLKTVENGGIVGGQYELPKNLSDLKDQFKFYYDVQDGVSYASNPNYYRDLIIQAINDLGFSITCP